MNGELIDTISRLGFPIAMCLWFMIRTEKVIKNNTEALKQFQDVISGWKR